MRPQELAITSEQPTAEVSPPISLVRAVVENFRSLRRIDIEFKPDLSTLIGENDSGKSVILQAIELLLDPRLPATPDARPAISPSDLPAAAASRPTRITLVFAVNLGAVPTGSAAWQAIREACPASAAPTTLAVRVTASHAAGTAEAVRLGCEVLRAPDQPIPVDDPWATLAALRTLSPAIRVQPLRATMRNGDAAHASQVPNARRRVLQIYRRLIAGSDDSGAVTGAAIRQAIADAGELVEASEWTRRRGTPMQRALRDLIAVPQSLGTTLLSAAEHAQTVTQQGRSQPGDAWPDARLFTMMLLAGALLDAVDGVMFDDDASPLILVDDLGDSLHPTWLAAMGSMITNLPAQKVVSTHSSALLARVPLTSVRRVCRRAGETRVFAVGQRLRSLEDQRRVSYHIRLRSPDALLARCWLLVEGETEAWIIPELARILGVEFPVEGIRCIEFAQSGVAPMVKIADDLGIDWHLLADGDDAGQHYAQAAADWCERTNSRGAVTKLEAPDIEHYLFQHGFADVYADVAGMGKVKASDASRAIHLAIKKTSKPSMALTVLEAANERGPRSIPPAISQMVLHLSDLARGAPPKT